jgi:hypothetical protein
VTYQTVVTALAPPIALGSDLERSLRPIQRLFLAAPTAEMHALVARYLAGKDAHELAELDLLITATEGPTMSEHDLIAAVAAAYVIDRQPERAELVRQRRYETVGPRTLRSPSGCLVTWMSCGCVVAHRARKVGRRIAICASGQHEGGLGELGRDSGGSYQGEVAA